MGIIVLKQTTRTLRIENKTLKLKFQTGKTRKRCRKKIWKCQVTPR